MHEAVKLELEVKARLVSYTSQSVSVHKYHTPRVCDNVHDGTTRTRVRLNHH